MGIRKTGDQIIRGRLREAASFYEPSGQGFGGWGSRSACIQRYGRIQQTQLAVGLYPLFIGLERPSMSLFAVVPRYTVRD
jgi:hypothetical protein